MKMQPMVFLSIFSRELKKVMIGKAEDYTTESFLDYDYFKKHYKLIAVDLSKQKELDPDPRAI